MQLSSLGILFSTWTPSCHPLCVWGRRNVLPGQLSSRQIADVHRTFRPGCIQFCQCTTESVRTRLQVVHVNLCCTVTGPTGVLNWTTGYRCRSYITESDRKGPVPIESTSVLKLNWRLLLTKESFTLVLWWNPPKHRNLLKISLVSESDLSKSKFLGPLS